MFPEKGLGLREACSAGRKGGCHRPARALGSPCSGAPGTAGRGSPLQRAAKRALSRGRVNHTQICTISGKAEPAWKRPSHLRSEGARWAAGWGLAPTPPRLLRLPAPRAGVLAGGDVP